nr:MAG TPA: hypothetical protein [Caudoviricetes sp.]
MDGKTCKPLLLLVFYRLVIGRLSAFYQLFYRLFYKKRISKRLEIEGFKLVDFYQFANNRQIKKAL